MIKKILVRLFFYITSLPLRIICSDKLSDFFYKLFKSFTFLVNSKTSLVFLFKIRNKVDYLIGGMAKKYGSGIHPKHWLIKYHNFFITNIADNQSVLDIGCGSGSLTYDIAKAKPKNLVVGIDLSKNNILYAKKHYILSNLEFVNKDIYKYKSQLKFDILILSNVLEHFKNRVQFLLKIRKLYKPKKIILRVPLFDRDWSIALQKELQIDYRLDSTHFTEYTKESFVKEITKANLKLVRLEIKWGEIWAIVR